MQGKRPRAIERFAQSIVGRVVLLAVALGLVYGAYYVTVLLAIPAILVGGLWLPIYAGLKRPRYLALTGLVLLLLSAPLITVSYTSTLLAPIPTASSGATGLDWSVSVENMTVHSQTNRIDFQLPSGSAAYRVTGRPGYTTTYAGHVAVGTASTSVAVAFSTVTYPGNFTETGLPAGTTWGITVDGLTRSTTGSSLLVSLPNGTFAYSITAVPRYTPPAPGGHLTIDGAPTPVRVAFARTTYPVTFTETGLPAGASWGVSAESSTARSDTASIVLELPNGTIGYTLPSVVEYSTPGGRQVTVAGAPVGVAVPFTLVTYPVTFTESRLPAGTNWSIGIGTYTKHATTAALVIDLPNGTYQYGVGRVTGYHPLVGNNTVTVNGGAAAVRVDFNSTAYAATFNATGLVAGTPWTITVGSATVTSVYSAVQFNLTNGTTAYAVAAVPGYTGPTGGSVDVSGHPITTAVAFTAVRYHLYFNGTHTGGARWNVSINGFTHSTLGGHVEFNLTNGTYTYDVGAPSGRTAPAPNGTVVVAGAGSNLTLSFAATTYTVAFVESGLPTGGALLADAYVTPFHGSASTEFTWNVTVNPQYLPAADSGPMWINLYISTCPGATSPNGSAVCGSGYSFIELTEYFCSNPSSGVTCAATAGNRSVPVSLSFNYTVGADGIWEWQMGLAAEDLATHTPITTLLVGDPTYNGLEGPVIGSFATIFEVVLPSVYLETFLYLGLPFYAALLFYAFYKSRERRRNEARERNAGPIPPAAGAPTDGAPGGTPAAPAAPAGPGAGEMTCPNCQAVVYPNETKCWKCGATLPTAAPAAAPPLPSGPAP